MEEFRIVNESRRRLLKGGAALTLALYLPALDGCDEGRGESGSWEANAFVRIGADDSVTVISKHVEVGQGIYTGLATLLAEELDADWSQVRVESAPADVERYSNTIYGEQVTGGSTSIANSFEQYRHAGAVARAMLVTAAAHKWRVAPEEIRLERGVLRAGARKARFGELVSAASRLPVPKNVSVKEPGAYQLIGRPAARVDSLEKVTGAATFTQDVRLPGMLTAVAARPPRFGAKPRRVDDSKARSVPGVISVVRYETHVASGVAVLATGFWAARQGRDALVIDWDETSAFRDSTDQILDSFRRLATGQGTLARADGDPTAMGRAARRLSARYEVPYLAHAALEPLDCVVQLGNGRCEIWNGEQYHTSDQANVAALLGIKPEQVKLNTLYAGGSFGRRANPYSDYIVEAVAIAQSARTDAPVKLVWTREDDMRAGFYRPMFVHSLEGGLDGKGRLQSWRHHLVGQSISDTPATAASIVDGIDEDSVDGAVTLPYEIPNLRVELTSPKLGVPVTWWRSVGASHNAWATECFIDELAHAAHRDPLEFRRELLARAPRHLAVLELAATKASWGTKLPAERARGIAVAESEGSCVAYVVEISRRAAAYHLDRVVGAVDCGLAINPNIIAMQVESGVCFGLSAALKGRITLDGGRVEQGNFDGYPILRMNEMPPIEVHIVTSTEKPTGIGEPGVPPIAPALCNALFALRGEPVRSLPLSALGIEFS